MRYLIERLVLTAFSAAALVACGSIREQVSATVVTAIASDVTKCKRLGFVATTSPDSDKYTGLDQMRAQAVQKGGNTVYVTSYSQSTTGTAYACDPPLNPDTHFARPES